MSHRPGCELCYQRNRYSVALENDVYCQECKDEIDTLLNDVAEEIKRDQLDDFDMQVHSDELREE